MSQTVYDALVIGSGAAGSFAAKEMTAQGLSVLLLEAGPAVTPRDFDPNRKKAPASSINIWERARATLKGQPIQARAAFFTERFSHFFVNDRKNPYTTPKDAPFCGSVAVRAAAACTGFGRVLLRWTDDDFKIKSKTGKGEDWPVSYDELKPYYAEVESSLGLYGNPDGVETLPDGIYAHPAKLTPAEETFKTEVEGRWPKRHVVSWRYIAPDAERTPKPLREALATGRLTSATTLSCAASRPINLVAEPQARNSSIASPARSRPCVRRLWCFRLRRSKACGCFSIQPTLTIPRDWGIAPARSGAISCTSCLASPSAHFQKRTAGQSTDSRSNGPILQPLRRYLRPTFRG